MRVSGSANMVPLVAELRMEPVMLDGRLTPRRTCRLRVSTPSLTKEANALILNISENGLLIETTVEMQIGETLYMDLPEAGLTRAVVIWNRQNCFGCEFVEWISKSAVSAAILRSSPERLVGQSSVDLSVPNQDERDPGERPLLVIARLVLPFLLSILLALIMVSFGFAKF